MRRLTKRVGVLVLAGGIGDDEIEENLYAEDNVREIELFIGKDVDASPCLP